MATSSAPAPQFDAAAAAHQAASGAGGGQHLVVVAFVDRWAPPAYATAVALDALRSSGAVSAFASIFIVDATAERDAAHDAGVLATPALLFYWDGVQASVRRPAWDDDDKYTGAAPADRLVEIIRHARDCCVKQAAEGAPLVIGLE